MILAEESVVHQKEIRTHEVPFEAVKNGTLETRVSDPDPYPDPHESALI